MIARNTVHHADAFDLLRQLPDGSVDAVITDPPYPGIKRQYGTFSEAEWHTLMRPVVTECKRVLKPQGSALFVIQPNHDSLGSMNLYVWRFMVWVGETWNIVQDAYWWNHAAMPGIGGGLLRPSVKTLVWAGNPDCYKDQEAVLWRASDSVLALKSEDRALVRYPSGHSRRPGRIKEAVLRRGGSSPFNILPLANTNSTSSGGALGHGAATPLQLFDWWIRYLCPPNGLVVDPFAGSGTTAVAARQTGREYIVGDSSAEYVAIMRERLARPYTLPMLELEAGE